MTTRQWQRDNDNETMTMRQQDDNNGKDNDNEIMLNSNSKKHLVQMDIFQESPFEIFIFVFQNRLWILRDVDWAQSQIPIYSVTTNLFLITL